MLCITKLFGIEKSDNTGTTKAGGVKKQKNCTSSTANYSKVEYFVQGRTLNVLKKLKLDLLADL